MQFKLREITVPFGSYKGKTLSWIYQNDPKYINWLVDNCREGWLRSALDEFMNKKTKEIIDRAVTLREPKS